MSIEYGAALFVHLLGSIGVPLALKIAGAGAGAALAARARGGRRPVMEALRERPAS